MYLVDRDVDATDCHELVGVPVDRIGPFTGDGYFYGANPDSVATPYMSVFVDRFDRRKLLVLTQSLSMVQALLMALLTLTGLIQVWHIMILSLLIGLINALDNPTRQSFYPSLVPKDKLSNAIALNSAVINGSRLIGSCSGWRVDRFVGRGYLFPVEWYQLYCRDYCLVDDADSAQTGESRETKGVGRYAGWLPVCGWKYTNPYVVAFNECDQFLRVALDDVYPGLRENDPARGSEMLGLLLSCIGVGSFIAALYLAARKSVLGLGKVVMLSGALLGIGLSVMSFVTIPWVAAVLCLPVGFTIIAAVASINTLLQTLSGEDKRGRVMGYMAMSFTGMAPVGSMVLGALEKWIGLQKIILLSGICCFVAAYGKEVTGEVN